MSRPLEVLVTCSRSEDRSALARILARRGFRPLLSSSVEKSCGILAQRPVRLVFCDDELPDGSVGRLLEEIRKAASRVPVVVISRLENWDEYLRAMRLGAFDYISSPLRRAEVERVIAEALEQTPPPPRPPQSDPDGSPGVDAPAVQPEEKGSDERPPEAQRNGGKREPRAKAASRRPWRGPRGADPMKKGRAAE